MSTFLVLAAFSLILGVLPFWLTRYIGRKTGPTDTERYIGIGGWLVLLIVSFGIWSPLYGIASFVNEFNEFERAYPAVLRTSEYQGYKSSVLFLFVILYIIQIYLTGLLLYRRERSSVSLFKKFLLLSPLVCFVLPILSKIYFPKLEIQQWPETLAALFWMIVINGFWFLYLHSSRRIRSTYGITQDRDSSGLLSEPPVHRTKLENSEVHADPEDLAGIESNIRRDSITSGGASCRESGIEKSRMDGKKALLRKFGESNFDEALWSRCLAKSGSDQIRACAEYWRIKSEK